MSNVFKPLGLVVITSAFALSACTDDKQMAEATSTDKPVITSEVAQDVKPPQKQASAMEVKEKPVAIQPEKKPEPVAEVKVAPVPEKVVAPTPVKPAIVAEPEKVSLSQKGAGLYATCIGCHGANAEGGIGPKLQEQTQAELIEKLNVYRSGKDRGPMSAMMIPNAQGLSEEDVEAVAAYIVAL